MMTFEITALQSMGNGKVDNFSHSPAIVTRKAFFVARKRPRDYNLSTLIFAGNHL